MADVKLWNNFEDWTKPASVRYSGMRINIASLVLALAIAGCQMVPQNRQRSQSIKGAEALAATNALTVHRLIEGEKAQSLPHVTISGSSNTVQVTPMISSSAQLTAPRIGYREELNISTTGGLMASAEQQSTDTRSVRLPLSVAIAIGGIGLMILTAAIRYALTTARNSSAAVRTTLDLADQGLSRLVRDAQARIDTWKAQAATATDPADIVAAQQTIASLQAQITEFETTRGKIAARKV